MEERSISSIHIQMNEGFTSQKDLAKIKDFLFGAQGNCRVYFHIDIHGKPFIVKGNAQMTTPSGKEFVQSLKDMNYVEDVWCE